MTQNFNIQKVLVAPLDWGLGHATRCIPIIKSLVNNGYEVLIAAEGAQTTLLQTEFPTLRLLPLKGYRVQYSQWKWTLPFVLLQQLPRLLRTIRYEQRWLANMIKEHNIDLVISDNRYGLYSKKVSCIFITHQLIIKAPFGWLQNVLQRINYRYINRFSCCWVPDVPGNNNVAGILSHPAKLPRTKVVYIGLLSRFQLRPAGQEYDYCILLSGPEPQRTLLEKKLVAGLVGRKEKILLVRGKPGSAERFDPADTITIKNHLPGAELGEAILQSDYVICRSGYTTVMELLALQKRAILIPTPGQTEQEYLAKKLHEDGICMMADQNEFNFAHHVTLAKNFPYELTGFPFFDENQITGLLKNSVSSND